MFRLRLKTLCMLGLHSTLKTGLLIYLPWYALLSKNYVQIVKTPLLMTGGNHGSKRTDR